MLHKLVRGVKKYSAEISEGLAVSAFAWAVIFAIEKTPEAKAKLDAKVEEKQEDLTIKEVVETAGPCYIPTAVAFGTGCGFFAGRYSLPQPPKQVPLISTVYDYCGILFFDDRWRTVGIL